MVLSKGKKIILIAAAAVIILVVGFLAWKHHSETQYTIDRAVTSVLNEDRAFSYADPYDEETVSVFIEQYWDPVKDKSSFQKELADRLNGEIVEVALHNMEEDRSDKEEREYVENSYGSTLTGAHETFLQLLGFLGRVDYEDEALKECFQSYYQRLAELQRTPAPDTADRSEQEQELSVAEDLNKTLEQVEEFNQAAGDFYQIQADQVATVEEVSQYFDQAIQLSYDTGDVVTFATALAAATSSPLLEEQTFMEPDQIVAFLINDGGELYTLRNGIGGYYDTHQIDAKGQISYYGDFAERTTTSGGNQYDMSEMTSEIWWALSPGQREEISSGNRTKTYHYSYLLGEDYDGDLNPSLGDDGYGYVYLNDDDSLLCFRSSSIYYMNEADFGGHVIYGDFSEQVQQAAAQYDSGKVGITEVAAALAQGEYETAIEAFLSISGNGTDLAAVDQLASELAKNGILDEGMAPIYEHLNLTMDEMIQLEISIAELQELYG